MADFERELRETRRKLWEEENARKNAAEREKQRTAEEYSRKQNELEAKLKRLAASVNPYAGRFLRDLASVTWGGGFSYEFTGASWVVKSSEEKQDMHGDYMEQYHLMVSLRFGNEEPYFLMDSGSTGTLSESELKELLKQALIKGPEKSRAYRLPQGPGPRFRDSG